MNINRFESITPRKSKHAYFPEAERPPRQGWKEQFDQATQLQRQLSEEDQEWLDAPFVTDEEEAW